MVQKYKTRMAEFVAHTHTWIRLAAATAAAAAAKEEVDDSSSFVKG